MEGWGWGEGVLPPSTLPSEARDAEGLAHGGSLRVWPTPWWYRNPSGWKPSRWPFGGLRFPAATSDSNFCPQLCRRETLCDLKDSNGFRWRLALRRPRGARGCQGSGAVGTGVRTCTASLLSGRKQLLGTPKTTSPGVSVQRSKALASAAWAQPGLCVRGHSWLLAGSVNNGLCVRSRKMTVFWSKDTRFNVQKKKKEGGGAWRSLTFRQKSCAYL